MSKIILNDVTNLSSLTVINDNFSRIEQALQEQVLYRNNPEGEPNTIDSDIDVNGMKLYNIGELTLEGVNIVDAINTLSAQINSLAASGTGNISSAALGFQNQKLITESQAMMDGYNMMSAGPVELDVGVVVTVPEGSTWTIV